jgi:hypothetical protein
VTVLCLMDAGNLARQALAIRDHHRGRELYVAIDDDDAGRKAGAACKSAGFSGILEPPRGERE